jgi:6-pyruvoyltetrahydropterin/6-carboxytetrahydropterin synthase
MLITKEIEFDAGHRVPNHQSKCRTLHGHRYRVEVGVDDKLIVTPGDSAEGMVIDFGDLKAIMTQQIDNPFDHATLLFKFDSLTFALLDNVDIEAGEFDKIDDSNYVLVKAREEFGFLKPVVICGFIPTAENIAKCIYQEMKIALEKVGINIDYVRVWETPTSSAIYKI